MDSCDTRTKAYKNGKTFDQCKDIARQAARELSLSIEQKGSVSWNDILERVEHDEIVYKLALKYLREDGYDIGDWKRPEVKWKA